MFSSAGANVLALHIGNHKKSSDDRPRCLENPRSAGAESTLTENVASPFHAEPRHSHCGRRFSRAVQPQSKRSSPGFRKVEFRMPKTVFHRPHKQIKACL